MSKKISSFSEFSLDEAVLKAVQEMGYETPTPVQSQSLPILLNGDDLLAQAQTGTGKTAAFALPILSRLKPSVKSAQALVLAPTRELAIQVANNFQEYAKHIKGFKAIAIYGGQDFKPQLSALKRGPQVVVGTPGRLMDHLRRGTLVLDAVETLVIDEADEMLKMGFIDDVEWILTHITKAHQTALFSATLPSSIVRMAQKYLKNPKRVEIKSEKNAVETITQVYVQVSREQKQAVLMRFLALEDNQGVIIFTRTKNDSTTLAEKLIAHGYKAAALNGDMSQAAREKTIARLKSGSLNIAVATDVAARGLDVERITHVFNYDMPFDMDSYVHRIGRTGRAGREGKAILFVTPREMRFIGAIERHTNRVITRVSPPDQKMIQQKRLTVLSDSITKLIQENRDKLEPFIESVKTISNDCKCTGKEIAAALLFLKDSESSFDDNYQEQPLKKPSPERRERDREKERRRPSSFDDRKKPYRRREDDSDGRGERSSRPPRSSRSEGSARPARGEGANRSDRTDRSGERSKFKKPTKRD
ncbi:MAG: DEAD/DEAH box helicase [Coxiellaceae bacterium]|nr:DEAD/DEAH box helicase [Coxiellaceae bacterium]